MATLSDTGQVRKLHFIQCYQKARAEGLSERNIRSSWRAAGLVPWNPQKVPGSSQIMGSRPSDDQDQPTPNRKRARLEPEFLKTPKKPQDLYEAAQALDSPSRTSRIMFRKAGKAMAGLSVELASSKSANEALRSQLQDSRKGQRKRVAIDPNQSFADVDSTRNAQKAVAAAEVAKKAKTKSDEELKLASEQAGSLRMADMVFQFQI